MSIIYQKNKKTIKIFEYQTFYYIKISGSSAYQKQNIICGVNAAVTGQYINIRVKNGGGF